MIKIKSFLRLPFEEKSLFFKALYYIAIYCFIVYVLPSTRLKNHLGNPFEGEGLVEKTSEEEIKKVSCALRRAEMFLKVSKFCLVYALTGKKLLTKKGLKSVLYLGMRKENGKWLAHAWLTCHRFPVIGCMQKDLYQIIGVFHS